MSLRVISGELKGKKLNTLPGIDIRPTSDRIRETIFDILYNRASEANVLDLFAGTGAFGIEALSRGAKFCLFIDNKKSSLALIEKNICLCSIENKAKIIKWDIKKNLNCLKLIEETFDIVFMDPPYNKNLVNISMMNLCHAGKMSPDALIIIEHSIHEQIDLNQPQLFLADQRRYGKTLISFLTYT